MSCRLRDLIRAVRSCKTAAEEREAIAKESAALREAFRDGDSSTEYRHRNVAKLMYMHMLGYPTHFGQMETLKLIAANGFPEKRIGYLGLMLLLDERQEVLMLVTNSLKRDLNHKNQYIAGLALAALGNICSAEMARDLAPDVERLMEGSNPYLRKKAALCAIRIVRKVPELVESFIDRAASLLNDRNHNVMLAGVSLMLQICESHQDAIDAIYRQHVPTLCKILRQMLSAGSSPEHDIGGITDPFLQVKILRVLRYLGRGSPEASDKMSDILAQVAANVDGSRNSGNAVLYECVQTIMGVESISGLRILAVNLLGKFLANKDNNMRYVALNTLSKVVGVDTQAVQRHRATIVECVKDADVSIRRRALELVYSLVNESNIRTLTRELLDYLVVADAEFKPDLTAKICVLIQRFSPDKRWQIDHMLQVMSQAGQYVKEDACRSLIVLITNTTELQGYAVRAMYRNLHAYQDVADTSLLLTATWCLGEFGEMLLPGAGGPLLEAEPPLAVSELDIVQLIEVVAKKSKADSNVREFALTAAMKLTARLPNQIPRLKGIVEKFWSSIQLETQSRSAEFSRIFHFEAIRPQLMDRMPALDEADHSRNHLGGAEVKPHGAVPAEGHGPLLTADGGGVVLSAGSQAAAAASGTTSNGSSTQAGASGDVASSAAAAAAAALEDLLGGDPSPAPVTPSPPAASMADLLSGSPAAQPRLGVLESMAANGAEASAAFPSIIAYRHAASGVTVMFSFLKPAGNNALTEITATYVNEGQDQVTDFNLQAAVPKYMQLRLEPATSSVLPAGGSVPVYQKLYINNTMHGQKGLIMRLKLGFMTAAGMRLDEQTEVGNFPPGL